MVIIKTSILSLSLFSLIFMSQLWSYAAESAFPVTEISDTDQTSMIEDHCAVCHLDNAMNGGLSLEHFSAATVSPPLASILANKFTFGVPNEEMLQSELNPQTIEKIETGKKFGAPTVMGISGNPLPTEGEINGFILAMAHKSNNADIWHVKVAGTETVADIARVSRLPESEYVKLRDLIYRLVVSCDTSDKSGEVLLTWSPIPGNGRMEVTVDSSTVQVFNLDEQESMANGDLGTSAPASVILIGKNHQDKYPALSVPEDRLRIHGPIPSDPVEFPLSELWELEPRMFDACFSNSSP